MTEAQQLWATLTREFEGDPEYWAEELANTIAMGVARVLSQKGMSRTDLANRMGLSKGRISQLLNGQSNMTLVTLCKLAGAVDHKPHVDLLAHDDAAVLRFPYSSEATPVKMDASATFLTTEVTSAMAAQGSVLLMGEGKCNEAFTRP